MKIEDYNKYYIQGSDHYLIPKDVVKELFNEMINWKEESQRQKEAINKIQIIITDMQLELIGIKPYHSFVVDGNIIRNMTKDIEDILKEVSE